jgi:hypothetical protein
MAVLLFIKDLLVTTFGQMAPLLTGVFIFGLLIHFISLITFRSIERAFGHGGTYIVAWLGTPVHELGHALFCVIFMHKIVEIKFFKPDPLNGTLGYVSHQWNRSNPWQVLGNLFIGIGPVILGSAVLFAIFYFLIPDSSLAWVSTSAEVGAIDNSCLMVGYLEVIRASAFTMVKLIFTVPNLVAWRFWVFIYLAICVASNIRLSLSDIKGSLSGLGCLVLLFLLINFLGLVIGIGTEGLFPFSASVLGIVYSVLILALIMSLIGFLLTYLVSASYVGIRRRNILNPF